MQQGSCSLSSRINERHFGIEFGDADLPPGQHWHITLDGKHVEDDTREGYAGNPGWVRLYYYPKEVTCTEVRTYIKQGDVRAWMCEENHEGPHAGRG